MNEKKSKKKKIIIAIIVVLVLAVVLLNVFKKDEVTEPEYDVANIETKTLTTTISSTGTITTENSKSVTSQLMNYKITGVNVKVGDKVNVGDVLCTFDTADLAKTVSDLQATINVANTTSNISIASAERAVQDVDRNRNSTLDDLKKQLNLDYLRQDYENHFNGLNTAKANLAGNKTKLANLQSQATTLTAGIASLKTEKQTLQTAYNTAEATLQAAVQKVTDATSALEAAKNDPSQSALVGSLETALNTANAEKTTAETAKTEAGNALTAKSNTLAVQENQLKELTKQISGLQAEIDSIPAKEKVVNQKRDLVNNAQKVYDDTAATLNNQVANAQGQLESAKAQTSISTLTTQEQITAMQKQLADTNLKSTVAGTVTSVSAKAGDYYTGGTLLTIEGVETFIVETEIDEYDIADIEVGMECELKTDSTRDEILKGRVISVAPSATGSAQTASSATSMAVMGMSMGGGASSGSSATYTVKIELETQNDRLRLGMNAKLNIITEKSENVLAVPYDAVNEKEDGTKTITIIKDDNSEEEITVTTGLESGYYTEVSSDKLKEGIKVKIPKVDSTTSVDELLESMGATGGM